MWDVEYTDEFEHWWDQLSEDEQIDIDTCVRLLEAKGPNLKYPFSSGINGSRHSHMRELRIQHKGKPYRIFYAFDPKRAAILLIGGKKSGNDRWYEKFIPIADHIYDEHLQILKKEEYVNG